MKSAYKHRNSCLLSLDENEIIIDLFGEKCQSLATAVVQLFLTEAPDHSQWVKADTGVVCFIKDNLKRNYFFRMYCLERGFIWEQQLHRNIEYNVYNEYFHHFAANDCSVAFNFASEEEAHEMGLAVLEKLHMKRQKKEEKKSRNSLQGKVSQTKPIQNKPLYQSNTSLNTDTYSYNNQQIISNIQHSSTLGHHRITKADIGRPSNFKHINHIGFNKQTGFDLGNVEDPQLKQLLKEAGVSSTQLNDRSTRVFINNFIQEYGGLDVAMTNDPLQKTSNNIQMLTPPPVPARSGLRPNSPRIPSPVPDYIDSPPVVKHYPKPLNISKGSQPPISSYTPLPSPPPDYGIPPPVVRGPACPKPNQKTKVSSGKRRIPPKIKDQRQSKPIHPPKDAPPLTRRNPNAPPPPPPPPMGGFLSPPPLARSGLLDSIKTGTTLKPVEETLRKNSTGDSRGDLLSAIQHGIALKPVGNSPRPSNAGIPANSLAGALSKALQCRALAIQPESSSESEDEDEWV